MRIFSVVPLLAVPVLIYNVIAWSGTVVSDPYYVLSRMDAVLVSLPMASGATWIITPGHVLLTVSMSLLFLETLKATRTDAVAVWNHALSMLLFVLCLVEFLLFGAFATSVFFLLLLMCLLDTMQGFMITIRVSRRDISVGAGMDGAAFID